MYLEAYLALNANAQPEFLTEIAIVALELAIKNNEDSVLSFADCLKLLKDQGSLAFTLPMLLNLERHMLMTLGFRTNLPTSFDFLIQYAFTTFAEAEAR
jgi:hypothetical protein